MKYAALRLFTAEQEGFIRSNVKGIGNEELANMVNAQFGLNITKKQMKQWKCNHRPIGSERINVSGYTEVKVEEPNKWRPKHQVVWEREYGKIPKQHVIIFADGNKQNFDLDNLVCVSRQELVRLNNDQMVSSDKEVTQAYIGIVKLQLLIKKRKKENRK